ncbi:hypothetical protein APHAL10511_003711 [Amanita phalloides]|nr:hypothetical protein APHAL10511_003711 [Amanita phalloides]
MRLFISTLPFVFLVQSILAKPVADGDALVNRNMSLPANVKLPRALLNETFPRDLPANVTITRSVHVDVPPKESNDHSDTGNLCNESKTEDVGHVRGYKTTTVHSKPERRQEPSANVSAEAHPDKIKPVDLTTRRESEQDTAPESMALLSSE